MFASARKQPALLSDHMPITASSDDFTVISWNIMYQMQFNEKHQFFNNGFGVYNETDIEYENRLKHIASRINKLAETNNNTDFICLQECPKTQEATELLINSMKAKNSLKAYNYIPYRGEYSNLHLVTFYNLNKYKFSIQKSKKFAEIEYVKLQEGFFDRVLPLVLEDKISKETVLIVNVHANFFKEIHNDLKAIYSYASQANIDNMIFIGDFNRDLVQQSDDRCKHDISGATNNDKLLFKSLNVRSTPEASFLTIYNKETGTTKPMVETRDGCISSEIMQVKKVPEINMQEPKMRLTLKTSIHLGSYPKEVLRVEEEYKKCTQKFN